MADDQVTEPTQQELFSDAMAPPVEPVPSPPEPVVEVPPVPAEVPPAAPVADPEASIPSWRLREEAERARAAESRAAQMEARLNQITEHLKQSQKKPDFFENPDQATEAIIQRHLQPLIEESRRDRMYLGKMVAEQAHGADKVSEAEKAFLSARDAMTLDTADYEKVVQSPNRYDAVVQWHKRQAVLSSVGDDPTAWFEKQLEAKMADPAFQATMLEKARAGAATRPSVTKLPPSLSKATASAPNSERTEGDMSDASLFAHAMKR